MLLCLQVMWEKHENKISLFFFQETSHTAQIYEDEKQTPVLTSTHFQTSHALIPIKISNLIIIKHDITHPKNLVDAARFITEHCRPEDVFITSQQETTQVVERKIYNPLPIKNHLS